MATNIGQPHWRKAMRDTGLTRETIEKVVEATLAEPTDLIILETASQRYEVPYGTLLVWVHKGTVLRSIHFLQRDVIGPSDRPAPGCRVTT